MGRIYISWKSFRNDLELMCHPIGNWLYLTSMYLSMCDQYNTIVEQRSKHLKTTDIDVSA